MIEEKLYYSIGEVAELLNVNQSLIRFWEKEFSDFLKTKKNRNGKRMFTSKEIQTLREIYHLTKNKGFTLQGARNFLQQNKKKLEKEIVIEDTLQKMKTFLLDLNKILDSNE